MCAPFQTSLAGTVAGRRRNHAPPIRILTGHDAALSRAGCRMCRCPVAGGLPCKLKMRKGFWERRARRSRLFRQLTGRLHEGIWLGRTSVERIDGWMDASLGFLICFERVHRPASAPRDLRAGVGPRESHSRSLPARAVSSSRLLIGVSLVLGVLVSLTRHAIEDPRLGQKCLFHFRLPRHARADGRGA